MLQPANAALWLPYSPDLVAKTVEGANVNMGVSVRSRDNPYLRFPGAVRALVLQR
jgi:hypothetical protein